MERSGKSKQGIFCALNFLRFAQHFIEDRRTALHGSGVWIRSPVFCIGEGSRPPSQYKSLNAVTVSSAEQEEDILFVGIYLEVEFYNGCQPVNATPQVHITGNNVKLPESGCVIQNRVSLLPGRAVLPRLNSKSLGQGFLSGSQDSDGKQMLRLVIQQEV